MTVKEDLPLLSMPGDWESLAGWVDSGELASALRSYLPRCRWFGAKSLRIADLRIESVLRVGDSGDDPVFLCILSVSFGSTDSRRYLFPLARAIPGEVDPKGRVALLGPVSCGRSELVDGFYLPEVGKSLLARFFRTEGELDGLTLVRTPHLESLRGLWNPGISPVLFRGEQSNTSLLFGHDLMLKCFRQLGTGINPDLEIGAFLSEAVPSAPIPPTGGALLAKTFDGSPLTLVFLQGFVENQGDAWTWMKKRLEDAIVSENGTTGGGREEESLDKMVRCLGQRTGELHLALGRDSSSPDFSPVPMDRGYLDQLALSVEKSFLKILRLLEEGRNEISARGREEADLVLSRPGRIIEIVRRFGQEISGGRLIRCHGDFHLGQVLVTPSEEVVFLDFEGEPALSLEERRRKSSPLHDVAGMIRSLHYLSLSLEGANKSPDHQDRADLWFRRQVPRYLSSYLIAMQLRPGLLPEKGAKSLLGLYLLRKNLYEIEYEINNRPEWAFIPLAGLQLFLKAEILLGVVL
jgi:maltose alpha-D-glucosyltransferase/alpha-amylase